MKPARRTIITINTGNWPKNLSIVQRLQHAYGLDTRFRPRRNGRIQMTLVEPGPNANGKPYSLVSTFIHPKGEIVSPISVRPVLHYKGDFLKQVVQSAINGPYIQVK